MKNKFLSLEWFKGTAERAIEKVVASKLESLMEEENHVGSDYDVDRKLYKSLKLVNDTLTIVMANGDIYSKPGATEEDYFAISSAKCEFDILNVIMTPQVMQQRIEDESIIKRNKALQKGIQLLAELDDFVVENDVVYLTGTSRSLPQLLVEKFIEIVDRVGYQMVDGRTFDQALNDDEEYIAHKRFFMWCCLNPRAEVADELYRFLMENSFRITKQGFFVALRNVVSLEADNGDNTKIQFISNAYNKVKAVWKKRPEDFDVYERLGDLKLIDTKRGTIPTDDNPCWKNLGNLKDLYLDLPNMQENRFTDDWTKTFDIRIGKVVSMPMEECNWSTQDCAAAGLHFTADQIHYVGCGDQSVLVLINPMKVVGIGNHKGRCYEYLPIMTVPREEATSILHDLSFDTLALDESYAVRELESLADRVKEGFAVESKKHQFNLPQISSLEINSIINSLEEMKFEISKRIVAID